MTITLKAKLAFTSSLLVFSIMASSQTEKLQEEKELEVVNFKSIKKVLQQDGLSESAQQKKIEVKVMKKEQSKLDNDRYLYPKIDDVWSFLSEYWLVKNAQQLGWDFEKPDYGLESSFRGTLEALGFYHKHYKILLLNTPSIVRASLPGNDNEMILLLSVPFIRSADLSKLEISLLLLEDYFRLEAGYFKKAVTTEKLSKLSGTNFKGNKPDLSVIEELMKNYNNQINVKGFTFQQQFEVTKKMDSFLKGRPEL